VYPEEQIVPFLPREDSQEDILRYLRTELFTLTPAANIRQYVASVGDIYEMRALLKECRWDTDSLDYLLSVFVQAVTTRSRFVKKVDCFKVLRYAIRRNFSVVQLPNGILDKLFFLYKEFLCSTPPVHGDIVYWLSVALKDQILSAEQVGWLVENVTRLEDETILNRLLRYPARNEVIERWAMQSVDSDLIQGRESEVYGILINDRIPDMLKEKDPDKLAWGVYYSKNSTDTKERLLLDVAGRTNYRSVCSICYRLNLPSVIRDLIERVSRG
jgi:hypothetical protein